MNDRLYIDGHDGAATRPYARILRHAAPGDINVVHSFYTAFDLPVYQVRCSLSPGVSTPKPGTCDSFGALIPR
jgi:hypothetical protein